MKKVILLVIFLGLALSAATANATLIIKPNVLNVLHFNNVENWMDRDSNGTISAGDAFYGIANVTSIDAPFGTTVWNMNNTGSSLDTFTSYFFTRVTSVVPDTAADKVHITLGPGLVADPNGVISDGERAAGVVMKLWTDSSSSAYNTSSGSVTTDIGTATDGTPWGSLTLGSGSTYWHTLGPLTPPANLGDVVGDSWFGLNFLAGTGPAVSKVDDPLLLGTALVDWYGTSNVNVASSPGTWGFTSVDPAHIKPVPEPASMLLFGIGMLGSMAALRRKKKKIR